MAWRRWQAEEIKAARERLGLTQGQLAAQLHLGDAYGKDTVREWENGRKAISGPAQAALELMLERLR